MHDLGPTLLILGPFVAIECCVLGAIGNAPLVVAIGGGVGLIMFGLGFLFPVR